MSSRVITLCVWLAAGNVLSGQQSDVGPPPGQLVDVGGRKLHFICAGTGSPTVVIEAGASAFAIDFSLVQPEIAKTNRACSYDRAGLGFSDRRDLVDTPARIVADLHKALQTLGEKPPFVLVGASAGGLYVRLYQLENPTEVAGLVLIDPASEDRLFTMYQGRPVPIASLTAEQLQTTQPTADVGIPSRSPQTGVPFDRLPKDLYGLRVKLDQRLISSMPATVPAAVVREAGEGERRALARLQASRSAADNPMARVPVVVLSRGQDSNEGLVSTHAALARLSGNSRFTIVPDAGHEIHLFAPSAVIEAVRDVATAATQKTPLPGRP